MPRDLIEVPIATCARDIVTRRIRSAANCKLEALNRE